MKKRAMEKLFKKNGWWKIREGSNHEIWTNGKEQESLGRHSELPEKVCQAIIKRRSLR